jgi:hypothetical protein
MSDTFHYRELQGSAHASFARRQIVDQGLARIANEGLRPDDHYGFRDGEEAFRKAVLVLFIESLIGGAEFYALKTFVHPGVRDTYSLICADKVNPRQLITEMHQLATALREQQTVTVQCPVELLGENPAGLAVESIEIPADLRLTAYCQDVEVVVRADSSLNGLLAMWADW